MAQDPDGEQEENRGPVDISRELDMVTLYRSSAVDAGSEADVIRGILDCHGIPSLLSRAIGYPSLGCEVQVHRGSFRDAARLLEEAIAAGPAAAWEAEQAGEEGR